jgi:hypothetical protein
MSRVRAVVYSLTVAATVAAMAAFSSAAMAAPKPTNDPPPSPITFNLHDTCGFALGAVQVSQQFGPSQGGAVTVSGKVFDSRVCFQFNRDRFRHHSFVFQEVLLSVDRPFGPPAYPTVIGYAGPGQAQPFNSGPMYGIRAGTVSLCAFQRGPFGPSHPLGCASFYFVVPYYYHHHH